MPLKEGSSPSTVSSNIRELHTGDTYAHTEEKFGKRRADRQAIAIALDVARKARAAGGAVSPRARSEAVLPPNHRLGMVVPRGGSSCAKCRFLATPATCGNAGFVKWNGGPRLPAEADRYCCDLYEARRKRAAGGAVEDLPDVGEPLIGDGGQFSPGVPWANRAADVGSRLVRGMGEGAVRDVSTPGALMQPNPYPEGSEEAAWYDTQRDQAATQWGPSMALNTMGTGTAFAPAGAVGSAGGRLLTPRGGAQALDEVNNVLSAERALGASDGPRSSAVPGESGAAAAAREVGPGGGGAPGAGGLPEAQATAARWAGERAPLEGLPGPLKIGQEHFVPGPIGKIHDVAEQYMREAHPDRPYTPPTKYHPLDPEHSKAIAQAYEDMQHTPNDPATKASYEALIKETADQYQAIKKTGLKIEPIPADMPDPYAANPRMAARDVAENNHLWFYPTEQGFGTLSKISDNPMLRKTGEKIGGHDLLANDMFRVVHDYFGHLKEGHGFRAAGEDNAWRTHAQMYSDIARPAMTTETRGQNSWVNYGPHGEANRKASAADTVYADQKVGLLPEWTMRDRNSPAPVMVYHGTPHSFDRFDYSKIGSGEGNQAYGHGLYFAGHEPVSEWYRHQLATRQDPLLQNYNLQDVGHVIGGHLSDVGGDAAQLAAQYAAKREDLMRHGPDDKATANMIDEYGRRIAYLNDPQRSRGHLYQVAMSVNPEHLLDYAGPFKEQSPYVQERVGPEMEASAKRQQEAIKAALAKGTTGRGRWEKPMLPGARAGLEGRLIALEQAGHTSFPGNEIYKRMGLPAVNETEGSIKASQRLKGMGIPGLHYPDAGSRAPGQRGSRNYVMFGDEPLRIHRKYAQGGAAMQIARSAKKSRADGGGVDDAYDPMTGVRIGADLDRTEPEAAPNRYVRAVIQSLGTMPQRAAEGMLTLPQRALESSQRMVEGGGYDPAPILESAMIPMGTGAIAGARALPHEAILGAGPVRRMADDTGAAMTVARRAKKQLAEPAIVDRSKFVDPDTGMAIPGPAYTKEAQAINRDIAQQPKGTGPMDLSLQGQIPSVEQQPLERYVPPRGVSPRMQDAMNNPAVMAGLEDSMRAGAGVRDWYHTEPIRQEFIREMGPEQGELGFKRYMDLVAATSPRSDVPTNIRNASYYHTGVDPTKANPYPYGHVAQALHKQNVGTVGSEGGWNVMQNPKPASFAANLRGNLEPVTVDTHAFRNIAMRTGDPRFLETSVSNLYRQGHSGAEDTLAGRYGELKETPKGTVVTYRPQQLAQEGRLSMEDAQGVPSFWATKPRDSEYAAAEQMFRDAGARVGMRPADAQAAAWAGGGDMTGLGTVGTHTFPELMNERVMFTAKMRGEDPRKVLSDFVKGKKPLLSLGAGAAAAPVIGEAMDDRHARGGAVERALGIAKSIKRAKGGKVHTGAIIGHTDGRADEVPMQVPDGAYVLTADHVSSMGEGNTLAGFKKLDKMFPKSATARHAPRQATKRAAGGAVPIYAADGEYVICPDDITDRWGDLKDGHRYLDEWQTSSRKEHVNTLRKLAPPAQD